MEQPDSELVIVGHTSGSGSEQHNDRLSFSRAVRLRDLLIDHGIPVQRMAVVFGAGESEPLVAEDDDPAKMAKNRRVEIYVQGPIVDDQIAQLRPDPTSKPDNPVGSSKGIGCPDLREQVKWLLVEKEAWNQYYQRGPRSHSTGVRDTGGDGNVIAPDYVGIKSAAMSQGYHNESDWQFFESMIKLPATANLNAHLMEINRAIAQYRSWLQGNSGCDPRMTKVLGVPAPSKPRPNDSPQAGDTAPGGQKY
jgi:hypothetical protein